eukprot:5522838-Amphidinium_carterae.1
MKPDRCSSSPTAATATATPATATTLTSPTGAAVVKSASHYGLSHTNPHLHVAKTLGSPWQLHREGIG